MLCVPLRDCTVRFGTSFCRSVTWLTSRCTSVWALMLVSESGALCCLENPNRRAPVTVTVSGAAAAVPCDVGRGAGRA